MKNLIEKYSRYKKLSFRELRLKNANRRLKILYKKRMFTDDYTFDNRSNDNKNLLLILAGFQEFYWDTLFERIVYNQRQFNEEIDICVVVPHGGGEVGKLRMICKKKKLVIFTIKERLACPGTKCCYKTTPYGRVDI